MKTNLSDYVLSFLIISFIIVISLISMNYVSYFTQKLMNQYHVIADLLLFLLVYGLFSSAIVQLMLKYKPFYPGRYEMDDSLFTYWKLFTVLYEFGRGALLPFTTVFARPVVAVMFGAKIGKDIALGGKLVDPQLISIGEEAIIGQDSVITAHTIVSGAIILQPVKIGARATVGVNAVLMSGVEIGSDSVVTAGSVVKPDTIIPEKELWGGVPARKIKDLLV